LIPMDTLWNNIPVTLLHDGQVDTQVTRAGVLPFFVAGELPELLFMSPVHKPGRTPPMPQIAKGGRLMKVGGQWVDMDDRNSKVEGAELEPCIEAAMREGEEELGLLPENIVRLYDIGPVE